MLSIAKQKTDELGHLTVFLRGLVLFSLLLLVFGPLWMGRADMRLAMEMFSLLALAQMWNLLAGYSGLISVGQQAFVGLGGYLFFALAIFSGIPILLCIPLAVIAVALIAIPTGWIAFRLQGAYFAIGTWVIAEVFRLIAAQFSSLGGGSGISLPVAVVRSMASGRGEREVIMYYMAFAIGIGLTLIIWAVLRSKWGLALTAIRDNEIAAQSVGVKVRQLKFFVYIATAAGTALTGCFIFLQKLRITPEAAFSVTEWSAYIIFIVVIGGLGTIEGPIVGILLFFVLRELFADAGSWYLIGLGASAIIVMLINKRGIWGALRDRGCPSIFPVERKMKPLKKE